MTTILTTVEELDALPANTVVLDGEGRAWQRDDWSDGGYCWDLAGSDEGGDANIVLRCGSVTVLHEPTGGDTK